MMVPQLPLLTLKRHTKGFTLLEMMVVLSIIAMMTLQLGLSYRPIEANQDVIFEDEYKLAQIKAIATTEKQILETSQSNVSVLSFTQLGNDNMAQTISFDGFKFVVQLGMGRDEKR